MHDTSHDRKGTPRRAPRAKSAAVLSAALLLTGCLAQTHVSQDPLPLDSFCEAFFDALCEPLASCECGSAGARCANDGAGLCATFPSQALSDAVAEGTVRYDGGRAAALLRQLRSRAQTCGGFVEVLDWRVRDLLSLGGVFVGTRGAGEPCEPLGFELVSECAGGTCSPSGAAHVCHEAVGVGARCDRLHGCADLEGALTPERGIERLTLRCVPLSADGDAGTCAAWVDEGARCETDGACWSGRCLDGVCRALDEDAACFSGRECASGYCAPDERRCRAGGGAEGQACDDDTACLSRVCVDGLCRVAGCGTF